MTKPSTQRVPRGRNKQLLLQKGLELFYQNGFHATGIQDIASSSQLPKGSFYNYFASKEDFAVQVIQTYTEQMATYLNQALLQASDSPLKRLQMLFQSWADDFVDSGSKGCLAGNLTQELANQYVMIQAALNQFFDTIQVVFNECLRQAQATGEVTDSLAAESLGEVLYNSWQGAVIRAKSEGTHKPLQQFSDVTLGKLLC